ncbi:branched-chain amino acid ABC transporter permease [Allostreptomyces psammosilenae]|uniref:Branched-chain amino acid transport system permease protein n=1 Tax=Allostreptomyces psammosilenae TaxID=1892865 RepID=A0A853A130_9ACTN|nr:branched-chain amino acid ABC transporter permease [Allostreptomyces psammosilenae]NYI07160.1 branched-chain amino acid transport system permease protein [Allostreptomyces psammosilenae]
MSAVTTNPGAAGARPRGGFGESPELRRAGTLLAVWVLLCLVSGPEGNGEDLWYGIRAAFTGARPWILFGLLALVWVWGAFGGGLRERLGGRWRSATAGASRAWSQAPWSAGGTAARRGWRLGALAVVVVAVIVVPTYLSTFWQQVLVDQIAVYVLLAIGLNVVIGWAGLLDMGFVAFFAIGAYSAAFWTGHLPIAPPVTLNPFLVIPISIVTCLLAGLVLGAPTLRLRGDYLAIVTLGFHEIIYLAARNAEGVTGGSRGASGIPHFELSLGPINYAWELDPLPYWWLLAVLIGLLLVAFNRLEHSRVGRAWAAIREDEVAAEVSGVATMRYKLMAFAIGASTSGVAGTVYASKVGFINPENFPLLSSVLVLAYVIFGGMGSLPGVILGAAVLAWLPQFLRDYVDPRDRFMYLGALLVLMMIYRPQGLLPSRRRRRELLDPSVGGDAVSGGEAEVAAKGGVV